MIDPQLIKCPRCELLSQDVNLGSITSQGYLIIMRKGHRSTLVMAESYSVICDCGFSLRVRDGMISEQKLSDLMNG